MRSKGHAISDQANKVERVINKCSGKLGRKGTQ